MVLTCVDELSGEGGGDLREAARVVNMPPGPQRRFAVALSFDGDYRDYVRDVARLLVEALADEGGRARVLFDEFHEATLAGLSLDVELPMLYRDQSELVVVFLSPGYESKQFCRLEWRHIRSLVETPAERRVMLLSFGELGSERPRGLLPGDWGPDLTGRTPDAVKDLILERLQHMRAAATAAGVVPGWNEVTAQFLAEQRQALTPDDLTLYYNGQDPEWRHALAPATQIPRRALVGKVVEKLAAASGPTMVKLIGAAGEGKSTALLQIAAELVATDCRVLVRDRTGAPALNKGAVLALPAEGTWVLVTDDGDQVAPEVAATVAALKTAGRINVHWVVGARDTDWRARFTKGKREPAWARWVEVWPADSTRILALTAEDAEAIARAWEEANALGGLADAPAGSRGHVLLDASRRHGAIADGTLFGAVLEKRFGAAGLLAHVETLLERLSADAHALPSGTRADVFLYAAACDAVRIDGIDLNVVADLAGVPRERRRSEILLPLGAEAAAAGGGAALRTRHPAIARAAVRLVDEGRAGGADLEEIYRAVVRGTAETARTLRVEPHGEILNIGPRLLERLPDAGVERDRATTIALAAADEAVRVDPGLLVLAVTRAKTYRDAGRLDDASEFLLAGLATMREKRDFDRVGRGYLSELAVVRGELHAYNESLWLLLASAADSPAWQAPTDEDFKIALASVGAACLAILRAGDSAVFSHALRSVAVLGPYVTPSSDQTARGYWYRYARVATERRVPPARNDVEALDWLEEAFRAVDRGMSNPRIVEFRTSAFPRRMTFDTLRKRLLIAGRSFHR